MLSAENRRQSVAEPSNMDKAKKVNPGKAVVAGTVAALITRINAKTRRWEAFAFPGVAQCSAVEVVVLGGLDVLKHDWPAALIGESEV